MQTELELGGGGGGSSARYISWAPVPARLRLSDSGGVNGSINVRLRNRDSATGGRVQFFPTYSGSGQSELQLTLPASGAPVQLYVAGEFGRPSLGDDDALVEVVTDQSEVIDSHPLMVRVRKNANSLTAGERDRLLAALAAFNDSGRGRFADFRNVHTSAGSPEAHSNAGFLPWHRSFLLDLERELQAIDPRVALPYWRFDEPAPRLFRRDFFGVADQASGRVLFTPTNPLRHWATDGTIGIVRRPTFNAQTSRPPVRTEMQTLALGKPDPASANQLYTWFRRMEGDPHAGAHNGFTGSLSSISTAAKDPLFFLLHSNVDRLWAKWQWAYKRFDAASAQTYEPLGKYGNPGTTRIGHNLLDTMWPWNGKTIEDGRPPTAPGGPLAASIMTSAPGLTPTVGDMLDYQGVTRESNRLGFDYDDVPFMF